MSNFLFVLRWAASVAGAAWVLAAAPGRAEVPVFPLDQLVPGTIGIARTVFSGTAIDPFSVEILSVVHDIGPDQDLVLARALGPRLERTGVAQGMSGSPVFVDGKLVGAISSTWSFVKEPMLGNPPFGQMFDEAAAADRIRSASSALGSGRAPGAARGASPSAAAAPPRATSSPSPIGSPLALSGFDRRVVALADSLFRPWGFTVAEGGSPSGASTGVASGAAGPAAAADRGGALGPGATLGVQLVGGDVNMTAIGTVTWVEGDRVYGWGHPFLSIGEVEMPLVGGTIHAIVPSQLISFKMGSGGEVVGTVTGDHRSGIFGRLGNAPPTTAYDLTIRRGGGASAASGGELTESYRFELVRHRELLPLLVGLVSSNALLAKGGAMADETVSFSQKLVLDDGRSATVRTWFAGEQNLPQVASLLSEAVRVVAANPFEEVSVERIEATLAFEPEVRLSTITEVAADADTLRPGDTLRGKYRLRDWRGSEHDHPFAFEIPANARAGRYLLLVADAATAEQFEAERDPRSFAPRTLDELLARIDRLRRTNEVHLHLYRATQGVLVDGRPLPDLPVSALSVMRSAARSGIEEDLPAELVAESRADAGRLVQGSHTIRLEVTKEKP